MMSNQIDSGISWSKFSLMYFVNDMQTLDEKLKEAQYELFVQSNFDNCIGTSLHRKFKSIFIIN